MPEKSIETSKCCNAPISWDLYCDVERSYCTKCRKWCEKNIEEINKELDQASNDEDPEYEPEVVAENQWLDNQIK